MITATVITLILLGLIVYGFYKVGSTVVEVILWVTKLLVNTVKSVVKKV